MTRPYSHDFAIPQDESEEARRSRRQELCGHSMYIITCSHCLKVLGSELGLTSEVHTHDSDVML